MHQYPHCFSVPPMIKHKGESGDLVAREGENQTLSCEARGHPRPQIVWRREDGKDILVQGRKGGWKSTTQACTAKKWFQFITNIELLFSVPAVESAVLQLNKISRLQMGEYLCVASNGVMPSASKKFRVSVQCKPPPPVTTARMNDLKLFIFKFIYYLGYSRVKKSREIISSHKSREGLLNGGSIKN